LSLILWTETSPDKVYESLGSILRNYPESMVRVVNDMLEVPKIPGTKTILAMGEAPIALLQQVQVLPKNRKVTTLRGVAYQLGWQGVQVMPSYSPGISQMDYGRYIELQCDLTAAIRLTLTGTLAPKYGDYTYEPDFKKFREMVGLIYEENEHHPVDVAWDLETIGLDEFKLPDIDHPGAYVVSIQATCISGYSHVVRFSNKKEEEDWFSDMDKVEDLSWLMATPTVKSKGANLKFDLRWLWRRGNIECTNFVFDTTLVGSLLDENRSNGLDVHTKIYVSELGGYSDEFDRTVDKSRMDKVPPGQLLLYAGGDSDATYQVAAVERKLLLQDQQLTSFYVNVLHPAARAFEVVERGGIFVDLEKYKVLESDLDTEILSLVGKAKSVLGGRIWAKHYDVDKMGGMNLTKASMIVDFMFSPMGLNLKPLMWTAGGKEGTGDKAPSTAMEHLMMFKENPEARPFIEMMSSYSSATKTKNTYVTGFLKHIRSDGRYHPSYYFFAGNKDNDEGGTNTGRLSCRDPAFQTIPKHTKWAKRLRECYIAPPGHLVVERDYNQGELRVFACLANEMVMISSYLKGMDLHSVTSGKFSGYTYEQMMNLSKTDPDLFASIRQLGKAGNFGLIYGMGDDGFLVYAVDNYGVKDFTITQAHDFREGFMGTYPGIPGYHIRQKNLAREFGQVRSPLGRIRHLPLIKSSNRKVQSHAERQSINAPTQSTLSDMLLWVISLEHKSGLSLASPSFGACHDAAYNYVLVDKIDMVLPKMISVMENLPFSKVGWTPQLKFLADAKVGTSMGDLSKYKGKM